MTDKLTLPLEYIASTPPSIGVRIGNHVIEPQLFTRAPLEIVVRELAREGTEITTAAAEALRDFFSSEDWQARLLLGPPSVFGALPQARR